MAGRCLNRTLNILPVDAGKFAFLGKMADDGPHELCLGVESLFSLGSGGGLLSCGFLGRHLGSSLDGFVNGCELIGGVVLGFSRHEEQLRDAQGLCSRMRSKEEVVCL